MSGCHYQEHPKPLRNAEKRERERSACNDIACMVIVALVKRGDSTCTHQECSRSSVSKSSTDDLRFVLFSVRSDMN